MWAFPSLVGVVRLLFQSSFAHTLTVIAYRSRNVRVGSDGARKLVRSFRQRVDKCPRRQSRSGSVALWESGVAVE